MNIPTGRPSRGSGSSKAVIIAVLVGWSLFVWRVPRADPLPAAAESRPLASGLWGGDHVRMTVNRTGAELEYDCADSTIDQPIIVDARGRFTAKGSYRPAHGGPRREGRDGAGRARYVGEVRADTMRLTVTLENAKQPAGSFTLRRGDDPLLTKCR
jgi:hypothetical protein